MENQNKTLFTNTQIIIVSVVILILGLVGIYAFSKPSTEETVQTEEVNEEPETSETSETSENIENIEGTTTTREFGYQQQHDINDYIDYLQTGQNEYMTVRAEYNEELDAFVITAAYVETTTISKLAIAEEEDYASQWKVVTEDFSEWAKELARLSTDPEMKTYVKAQDEEEVLMQFVGGNLAYDIVNGYADWAEVE